MKVLIHRTSPGVPPAGVWWHAGNHQQPQHFYLDQAAYLDGSMAVLGDDYDGEPLSNAEWSDVVSRLTNSGAPFYLFSVEDTSGDPRDLLAPVAS